MIVSYAKERSLRTAIVQTFDGAHPCSLCHAVNQGENSEEKTNLQSPTSKIDLICVARTMRLLPPFAPVEYGTGNFSSLEIRHSPPVPPPRFQLS